MHPNYSKRITEQTARIRRVAATLPIWQRHALLNACDGIELHARRQQQRIPETDNRTPAQQSEQVAEQYNTAQRIVAALLSGRTLSQRNSAEFKTTAFHSRIADARRILARQYPDRYLCSRFTTDAETIAGRPFKLYWLEDRV